MRVRVGHSPDPDDAFMYWAIAAGRVDTRGHEFEPVVADIETLNGWALEGRLEVTALSAGAYPHVRDALRPAAARRVARRRLRPGGRGARAARAAPTSPVAASRCRAA